MDINEKDVTLRDYFAAHALCALIGTSSNQWEISQWAYRIADAMIETRDKKGE